jgi:2-iminobutanoate/2-iminopropanoate deaminase
VAYRTLKNTEADQKPSATGEVARGGRACMVTCATPAYRKSSESPMPVHHFSPQLHQSTAPFSHFVQHGATGYTAGIIGQRTDDGSLVSGDVAEQCEAMMNNLKTLLGELRLSLSDLLRTTIYLTDYEDFEAINAVYARYLREPFPVRTTVQVAALPLGAKVQIDTVVAL